MNQWSMKETHSVTGYYMDKSDLAHTALCIKRCELMCPGCSVAQNTKWAA